MSADSAPFRVVCNLWARTYHRWHLYLHPLRRYERWYRMYKMGWFGPLTVTGVGILWHYLTKRIQVPI